MLRNKLALLTKTQKNIFRANDISLIWGINNASTLTKTLYRYTQKGLLYRIYKGLYSIIPLSNLDKYEIACAIGGPFSYVSAETVLVMNGLIMQDIKQITIFGSKSKQIDIEGVVYLCRYLNTKYLLNRVGIKDDRGVAIATVERAIADLKHINPLFHIDNTISINTEAINKLIAEIGYNDNTK